MKEPSKETVAAWTRLLRIEQKLLADVEADLKAEGFPPLAWYDALLALSRAEEGYLRPLDLERAMLLPQYSTSRLIDRMVKAGLCERRVCPVDGRGQYIAITPEGRKLQQKMWPHYAAAIERRVGAKLSKDETLRLAGLLEKLIS
jgi:DNA-binding MarR family transcriptional regulator